MTASPENTSLLEQLILKSRASTFKLFGNTTQAFAHDFVKSDRIKIAAKITDEYAHVVHMPAIIPVPTSTPQSSVEHDTTAPTIEDDHNKTSTTSSTSSDTTSEIIDQKRDSILKKRKREEEPSSSSALVLFNGTSSSSTMTTTSSDLMALAVIEKRRKLDHDLKQEAKWQPPWKLKRVIAGHRGWVRALAIDCSNEWFASAGADRTIKIWDLASGVLKLTLTGHASVIRGLCVSDRHPYLFSVAEDKMVKCWDLEQNKQVRQYHGHLSGVYCCCLHPTLDVLITGGRDSTARVWDMRTKNAIHVLTGHDNVVSAVCAQAHEPQVMSGSMDSTVRCWDLASGKSKCVLTHHKKSVRSLVIHPSEYTFASASPDSIKKWKCPEPTFLHNFAGHHKLINALAVNQDNVLVSCADDGSMYFWDWKTGINFQQMQTIAQPGSLDAEAGIFAAQFDHSGSRLLTAEADKTIKVWAVDEDATPETHPNLPPPTSTISF